MAECQIVSLLTAVGILPPELASAYFSYQMARSLLDAQKEVRQMLRPFAFEQMEMAEEIFASFMALRAWDQLVYDEVKNIECDPICETSIDRGRITGHFVAAPLLERNVFGHSRYNCGHRSAAINDALSQGLIAAGEGMTAAGRHEDLLQEACQSLQYTSIATSAAFRDFNPSSIYGAVGDHLMAMDEQYGKAASGALATFGASLTHFAGNLKDAYGNDRATIDARRSTSRQEYQQSEQFVGPRSVVPGAYGEQAGKVQGIIGF